MVWISFVFEYVCTSIRLSSIAAVGSESLDMFAHEDKNPLMHKTFSLYKEIRCVKDIS